MLIVNLCAGVDVGLQTKSIQEMAHYGGASMVRQQVRIGTLYLITPCSCSLEQ